MAKSFQFAHLLKHARHHYQQGFTALKYYCKNPSPEAALGLAGSVGALNCLYYQALGCDEVLLAKSIFRRIRRIDCKLHSSTE